MKLKLLLPLLIFCFLTSRAQINTGYGTYYANLGTPYGGCGVPQDLLETPYYVALNMFHSPGNYGNFTRPLKGTELQYMGEFSNGANCGRWVKVDIGRFCQGINDGAQNQAFCRGANAKLVSDKHTDATMYLIVADGCPDANAWCRDDPYHLDIAGTSLNLFEKNGVQVNDMYPNTWNNREIDWEYVPAPNYKGDINIYFIKDAFQYWPAIMINNLPNGIHSVEQKVGTNWVKAAMNADLGQSYILPNTTAPYRIRITDANDKLLNGGREYIFNIPGECGSKCSSPATKATYTTSGGLTTSFEETINENGYYLTIEEGLLIVHNTSNTVLSNTEFVIYDLEGEIINSKYGTQHNSFLIASLKQGAYVVVSKNEKGEKKVMKVIY